MDPVTVAGVVFFGLLAVGIFVAGDREAEQRNRELDAEDDC